MAKKKNDDLLMFDNNMFMEHEEHYEKINIADETKRCSIITAMNRNIARHIPAGYDGLKPVVRRILLTLYNERKKGNKFIKVNTVAGNTMSEYHPHGDTSIMEVLGYMGQEWANNMLYIDPDGVFGNVAGDPPAAGRYIKCKLSKFAYKCFFEDYKYAALDMKPTYNGYSEEPEYLPAKYPIALINPQFSSIGWGTAANIAPFNFTEVLKSTIKLLNNPESDVYLIPDFPSGCDVILNSSLDDVNYNSGIGKVTTIASYSIDHDENSINITSLPHKIGTKKVTSEIARLVLSKSLEGIRDIKDNSSTKNGGVRIKIILDKSANADNVMAYLLKKDVGLKKTFGVQLKFILNYKEYEFSPKGYLLNWLNIRREIIRSMQNKKYVQLKEEYHLNEIKLFLFKADNIKKTVEIVKTSKNTQIGIENLMNAYKNTNITSLQAKTICDMRVREFNEESYQSFKVKKKELEKMIKECEDIIRNPSKIDDLIIQELEEGIELFGSPRRSKIIKDGSEKKIEKKKVLVAISKDGYIKKFNYSKESVVGLLGEKSSSAVMVRKICNSETLLIFDSTGHVSKVPVHTIPDMNQEDEGVLASRYFKVEGNIINAIPDYITTMKKEQNKEMEYHILSITKRGYVKKTPIKDFKSIRDTKISIGLNEGDEVVSVDMIADTLENDIMIYTNMGNGLIFDRKRFTSSGLGSKGRNCMRIFDEECVVDFDIIQRNKPYLFFITSTGKVKITDISLMPTTDKKSTPLNLTKLVGRDKLIAVKVVGKKDIIKVTRKLGEPVKIPIATLPVSMRIAKPEKKVPIPSGDTIVSVTVSTD